MPEYDAALEFRDVPGFLGYRAGTDGSVWTCWRLVSLGKKGTRSEMGDVWRRMRTPVAGRYPHLVLRRAGKPVTLRVHTIVANTFLGPRPLGHEVCHRDGNPRNNALENLRWGTHQENEADKDRHGRRARGERTCRTPLTSERSGRFEWRARPVPPPNDNWPGDTGSGNRR